METHMTPSTTIYFTKLQSDSFMIHGERYITSLYRPAHMQPPMCLQYSILAAGASASPAYKHMAETFYVRARQYIQADEMKVCTRQSLLISVLTHTERCRSDLTSPLSSLGSD